MDPEIVKQLSANLVVLAQHSVERAARQSDHAAERQGRQSDGAAMDMRVLGAAIANAVLTADDPQTDALLNAAVRTPSTIEHVGFAPFSPIPTAPKA